MNTDETHWMIMLEGTHMPRVLCKGLAHMIHVGSQDQMTKCMELHMFGLVRLHSCA